MNVFVLATKDLHSPKIWVGLAWHDIVQNYRRTLLGPFWLTLNMAIFALSMTIVYGAIFHFPSGEYSAYVVCSMMVWWWFMGLLNEGGAVFLNYSASIQSIPYEKSVYILSMAIRQLINLLHHAVIYILMILLGIIPINWHTLMAFPALALLFVWSIPVIAVLGILYVRYRDVQRLVSAGTIILMMVTPIFWKPDMITGWRKVIVSFNPVYYAVEVLRLPLLGQPIPLYMLATVIGLTIVTWLLGWTFYQRYQRFIVFWL